MWILHEHNFLCLKVYFYLFQWRHLLTHFSWRIFIWKYLGMKYLIFRRDGILSLNLCFILNVNIYGLCYFSAFKEAVYYGKKKALLWYYVHYKVHHFIWLRVVPLEDMFQLIKHSLLVIQINMADHRKRRTFLIYFIFHSLYSYYQ